MKKLPGPLLILFILLVATTLGDPLAIRDVANQMSLSWREGLEVSPDGKWLAHTVETSQVLYSENELSKTFVNLGSGPNVREAWLTNLETGEVVKLAPSGSFSWSPKWSPDGTKVAYLSDQSGEARVWVWDAQSKTSNPIPELVPWNQFYFQTPEWHPDSRHLVVAQVPPETLKRWKDPIAKEGGVEVRIAGKKDGEETISHWTKASIALIDTKDGSHEALSTPHYIRQFRMSPDGKSLAYTYYRTDVEGTYQQLFPLNLVDLRSKQERTLAEDLKMRYGSEWSWSPDSRSIAFVHSALAGGHLSVISLKDGTVRGLSRPNEPNLDWTGGERWPFWTDDGKHLLKGDGKKIYRFDAESGRSTVAAESDEVSFLGFMAPHSRLTLSKQALWLIGEDENGTSSLWRIAPGGKPQKTRTVTEAVSSSYYDLAVTPSREELVFKTSGLTNPGELQKIHPEGKSSPITRLNPGFTQNGQAQIVTWKKSDGTELEGTLLLPPDYDGKPLPTVFWVYAGDKGARGMTAFGLAYYPVFNFHTLATRGYAVFRPSIPYREGHLVEDINDAVLTAADALIEKGYSDPERLAVMGQSFGSLTTLALLVKTDRFKAAIITAISEPNLFALYANSPVYADKGQAKMGGTPWTHFDRYLANSPFFEYDEITTPILIANGSEDNPKAAENLYRCLEQLGKEVEYRLYDGESHVIAKPENVADFWERRLQFLDDHLKL